jgi:hypothetical protein
MVSQEFNSGADIGQLIMIEDGTPEFGIPQALHRIPAPADEF